METELYVNLLKRVGPPNTEDRRAIRGLLGNKSFRRGLSEIVSESDSLDTLRGLDLTGPEGLVSAAERKGKSIGLLRAIEILVELTQEIEDNDDTDS